MIDWYAKVQELKAMADEIEMWVPRTEGHVRSMLGRNADELRRFAHQIQLELLPPPTPGSPEKPPGWVIEGGMPTSAAPDQEEEPLAWSPEQGDDPAETE